MLSIADFCAMKAKPHSMVQARSMRAARARGMEWSGVFHLSPRER